MATQAKKRKQENIPAAEWAVAILGAALVAIALIVLVGDALRGESEPAAITFTVDTVIASPAGYLARVTARNSGSETAAGLVIHGVLHGAVGAAVETSELVLDYLPGRSTREIAFMFTRDPARHRLSVSARGYQAP